MTLRELRELVNDLPTDWDDMLVMYVTKTGAVKDIGDGLAPQPRVGAVTFTEPKTTKR